MSAVSTARRRSELNTAAIPSSRRRSPSSRACRRPRSDRRLWLQPEATPSSLSSLMACVSDRAAEHGLDLHDVAGVRGGDHLAPADVETDVLTPARSPEHEVAGLH